MVGQPYLIGTVTKSLQIVKEDRIAVKKGVLHAAVSYRRPNIG